MRVCMCICKYVYMYNFISLRVFTCIYLKIYNFNLAQLDIRRSSCDHICPYLVSVANRTIQSSQSRWVGSWLDSCTHGDTRQTYITSVADPKCPICPLERLHPKINWSRQRFLQPADGLTRCRWQLGEAPHPKACQDAGSCESLLGLGARRTGGPVVAQQVRADWHLVLVCLP